MRLIVSEKAIAGERITKILSGGKFTEKKVGRVKVWEFEDSVLVPLRGHVVGVDFPKKYSFWTLTGLPELVNAPVEYTPSFDDISEALQRYGKKADELIIATDADREGESIGLEAINIVQGVNSSIDVKRVLFSAITPKDVTDAFKKLQKFDYNLADAADSRREIDLIWGAVLTRFVSITSKRLGRAFLSVGRVQTPTLGIVVAREKEILAFKPEDYWVISADLNANKIEFIANHKSKTFKDGEEAEKVFAKVKDAKVATVTDVNRSKRNLPRPTPFNTTDFLRAVSPLGLTPAQAMGVAEGLYMNGFISYPRTDNTVYPKNLDMKEIFTNLSSSKQWGNFAVDILKRPLKPSRGKKETTDHPPIHPVTLADKSKLKPEEWKVYDLIVRRFFATFMDDAVLDSLKLKFDIKGEEFKSDGQTVIERGWLEAYPYTKVKIVVVPNLKKSEEAKIVKIGNEKKQTKPPSRYTQGGLLQKMADLNLGTKATRAEMIKKLFDRDFFRGKKIVEPSEMAIKMIDTLDKYGADITSADMTAKLESEMDKVSEGEMKKLDVVLDSRKMLSKNLDVLMEHKNDVSKDMRAAIAEASVVGVCDKCGENLLQRFSRWGKPFVGCSGYPKCTNAYPLPGYGKIIFTGENCEVCDKPRIKVIRARMRPYEMCIYPDCKSKADWAKKPRKAAAAKKKPVAKKKAKKTVKKATKKTSVKKKTTKKAVSKKK